MAAVSAISLRLAVPPKCITCLLCALFLHLEINLIWFDLSLSIQRQLALSITDTLWTRTFGRKFAGAFGTVRWSLTTASQWKILFLARLSVANRVHVCCLFVSLDCSFDAVLLFSVSLRTTWNGFVGEITSSDFGRLFGAFADCDTTEPPSCSSATNPTATCHLFLCLSARLSVCLCGNLCLIIGRPCCPASSLKSTPFSISWQSFFPWTDFVDCYLEPVPGSRSITFLMLFCSKKLAAFLMYKHYIIYGE